ncbi:TetR/AcrR family transcriptional regulator [Brucella pseudogrignonensis]|jgi:AcrR family transcriptional regulator|uniref:Bacterial regulatory, tetR family protein n=1 Tax=Brucella pseudogrignonensis TaxID=419475 RepID=A0A256G361_9HYPH|nr:TetR/AcrR family transcriptional regulator [Brucella pseudogrignonensis]OYR21522.1 bacterial regulatory, tetR family protein [Brucella pseudogrignonensis]
MPAPRGRPRSFDRDDALRRVMEVFWAKGYEGAQLIDLTAAIGVTPPSFYAAFGSKEAAFREAVELYKATTGAVFMDALDGDGTARDAIHAMLMASIDVAVTAPNSAGCMLITGAMGCQPDSDPLSRLLIGIRRDNIARIEGRLERGREAGDVAPDANIPVLARFYGGMMQAISMQARDGATRRELEALIEPAMVALT